MRGDVIVLASSAKFGGIVSDIIGTKGLREVAEITGISAPWIGAMKRGQIPSEKTIAKFAAAFGVSAKPLFDAALEVKEDIDLERIIQAACEAAGLSTAGRLKVLDAFREAAKEASAQSVDAA
jgi:transcriptional regulator with XRE-family HTH domain